MKRKRLAFLLTLALFTYGAVAIAQDGDPEPINDPLEPMNRGIFWFNDQIDVHFLEPVAQFYDDNVHQSIREGVGNFFGNLRYPQRLLGDLVSLKFIQALEDSSRFLINSTVGFGGIFDIAAEAGLEDSRNDLGLALAYQGVPSGPYLVLPFLGPSNVRDGIGTLADLVIDPLSLLPLTDATNSSADPTLYGLRALRIVDQRAALLDAVKTGKESSVDYYLFLESAYNQYRRGLLYDGDPPDEDEEHPATAKERYEAKQRRRDAALIAETGPAPSKYVDENFY